MSSPPPVAVISILVTMHYHSRNVISAHVVANCFLRMRDFFAWSSLQLVHKFARFVGECDKGCAATDAMLQPFSHSWLVGWRVPIDRFVASDPPNKLCVP